MSDAAEQLEIFPPVVHPQWCDLERCTVQPLPATGGQHQSSIFRIPEDSTVPGLLPEHPPYRVTPRGDQPSRDAVMVWLLESPVHPGVPYVVSHLSWRWTLTGASLSNARRMALAMLDLCEIADRDLAARREPGGDLSP